jgi:cytidyltransferase-like protein
MNSIVVSGSFDDMRSRHICFLEEAAKLGPLHVLVWSDEAVQQLTGEMPKFTQEERIYFTQAVRFVDQVSLLNGQIDTDEIPLFEDQRPQTWAIMEEDDSPRKRSFCAANEIDYQIVPEADLTQLPYEPLEVDEAAVSPKKVVVTGCFDWLHSGHVRFFEETSELGDLYVVLGHDENVFLLKGKGHPQFREDERRYMAQSIRFVKQAIISSGHGWMDAEPEIALIKPDIYAVNEDGDKPEKKVFCKEHGLEYVVLKRLPKEGLPQRTSTDLRGF